MKTSAIVVVLAALVSGCTTSRAQTPVERPALDVPPAPPRVIDPAPAPEPTIIDPAPELPAEKIIPPPSKPRASSPRGETAKPEQTAKPEPPVEPPPTPAAQPPPPLRTPATVDTAAADKRIRDILGRTQSALNNIDYKQLTQQLQIAYDQAKSSIVGAEAALKQKNFELATEMADKADKLARQLQAR